MLWDELNLMKREFPMGTPDSLAVVRYVAGCMKRERQRIASILRRFGAPEPAIEATIDEADDAAVFQWKGPETRLAPAMVRAMAPAHKPAPAPKPNGSAKRKSKRQSPAG